MELKRWKFKRKYKILYIGIKIKKNSVQYFEKNLKTFVFS